MIPQLCGVVCCGGNLETGLIALCPIFLLQMCQHVAVESMKDCQQEIDDKEHGEMLADGTPFHGQECLTKGMTQ